jgi:non-heme chloroperoxidase
MPAPEGGAGAEEYQSNVKMPCPAADRTGSSPRTQASYQKNLNEFSRFSPAAAEFRYVASIMMLRLFVVVILSVISWVGTASASGSASKAPRTGVVTLPSGVQIRYVERGAVDPSRVVILLHGFTDSSYSFQSLMDRLDPTIQAIAIDQRGHGESSKPGCCYAPQDFAADVVAFMDARQIKTATIVGHSMGGVIAQLVTIRFPERVSGLVIVGSVPNFANPAVEGLLAAVKELSDPVDRKFAHEFQASTVFKPLAASELERYVDASMKVPARVWNDVLTQLLTVDLRADLRTVKARTLILWGDKDGVATRADQATLFREIPNATLKVYEDIGHAVHWEAPDRVAADLSTFVRGDQVSRR